jgi:hypothetical protein
MLSKPPLNYTASITISENGLFLCSALGEKGFEILHNPFLTDNRDEDNPQNDYLPKGIESKQAESIEKEIHGKNTQ